MTVLAITPLETILSVVISLFVVIGTIFAVMRFSYGKSVNPKLCDKIQEMNQSKFEQADDCIESAVKISSERYVELKSDTAQRHLEIRGEMVGGFKRVEQLMARFVDQNTKIVEQNTTLVVKLLELEKNVSKSSG